MLNVITSPLFSQYLIGVAFIVTGTLHFVKPGFYIRIMPDYIPHHAMMVYISGVAEMLGGTGVLVAKTQQWAAWGLIVLLLIFFTVHIDMLIQTVKTQSWRSSHFMILIVRFFLQFALIYWVYWACIQH